MTDTSTHADRGRTRPEGATRPSADPAGRGQAPSGGPVLLLVDDSPVVRAVVRECFEARGFRVETAAGAAAALAGLADHSPDVVVADVLLPDMDGFDFHRRVRATPGLAATAFVFLGSGESPPPGLRVRRVAEDWVAKPFDPDELYERVARLLARRPAPQAEPARAAVLSGSLDHLSLADLLQVLSMNGREGVVVVERGEERGRIVLVGGGLTHAECGKVAGPKAVHRMLGWTGARFRVVSAPEEGGEEDPVTIHEPTARLILDGVMARDEWDRFGERLPDRDVRLEVDTAMRRSLGADSLGPAENEVLDRAAAGERVGDILDRSPRPDADLAAALCCCLDLGVVRARG